MNFHIHISCTDKITSRSKYVLEYICLPLPIPKLRKPVADLSQSTDPLFQELTPGCNLRVLAQHSLHPFLHCLGRQISTGYLLNQALRDAIS